MCLSPNVKRPVFPPIPAGDPIEVGAAGHALLGPDGGRGGARRPLVAAASKTALGHTEAAAGMVGVVDTAALLVHRVSPGTTVALGLRV